VALAVLLGAFFAWRTWNASRNAPPLVYQTATATRGDVSARVTATGTLSAIVTVEVGSQVSGRIENINVDFNSRVKAGDVIAAIDPSLFRARVASAEAALREGTATVQRARTQSVLFERQAKRSRNLAAEGLTAGQDLEIAEANVHLGRASVRAAEASEARLRAELEQAQLNLTYATIVSPIDGVVVSRDVDVGQTVAATLQAPTLFTIAQDLRAMQVEANVSEADVAKVRPDMTATFTVDAYPGRTFQGRVRQVRNAATTLQNVVSYVAVVDVQNPDLALKPGMTANVVFAFAETKDVVVVPNSALRFRPDPKTRELLSDKQDDAKPGRPSRRRDLDFDQRELWILEDGKARPVVVRVGLTDGSKTEILPSESGPDEVGEGTVVVTEAIPR
jgi:HlyD family secretion protein